MGDLNSKTGNKDGLQEKLGKQLSLSIEAK